jgi:prepilin-type N-terminal cleavage/methylation domain-containing protein
LDATFLSEIYLYSSRGVSSYNYKRYFNQAISIDSLIKNYIILDMMYTKKGFTLFEITIVLALIGLFFTATTYLTRDVRVDQKNAERLSNQVYDIVRNARNNMVIGRGVLSWSVMVVTKQREVSVSNTGITVVYQYWVSGTGIESSVVSPFFDNDSKYQITDISISSGGIQSDNTYLWDYTGATSATITFNPNSEIVIAAIKWGVPIWFTLPVVTRTIKVTSGYGAFEQSVIIDRITGTVETRRSNED